jgi:DNA-binding transcriptional LysR family regulator
MMHGTITQAAGELGLTQPAVSHALSALRRHYDDQLFVRCKGRMIPTSRALELSSPIYKALDLISSTCDTAFHPLSLVRTVRIGVVNFAPVLFLSALVARLHAEAPNVRILFEHVNSDAALKRLESAELDFGIGAFENFADMRRINLFRDSFMLITRKGHPLAAKRISRKQFSSARHIRIPVFDNVDAILSLNKLTRTHALTCDDVLSVPFIVAQSDLVALVPRSMALIFQEYCHIIGILPPVELPPHVVDLVYRPDIDGDPGHHWLANVVKSVSADIRLDRRLAILKT